MKYAKDFEKDEIVKWLPTNNRKTKEFMLIMVKQMN